MLTPEFALLMDGYDDCIVGVVERCGSEDIVCYSREKVIAKLMACDEMSAEDAEEFFVVNQLGSWMGEGTPCFISPVDE